jgi:hypothetical protein
MSDEFEGNHNSGQQGVMPLDPREGLTEEDFLNSVPPNYSRQHTGPLPMTMDEVRMQQLQQQIEQMQIEHKKKTATGEMAVMGVNHERLAKAQGSFIMEQGYFHAHAALQMNDQQYIDLLRRFVHEQAAFIRAQQTALHEAGVI